MQPPLAQIIQFSSSLLISIIGIILTIYLQKNPKLVTFNSHTSEIILKNQDGTVFEDYNKQQLPIRSHTIVIRNIGTARANNVIVTHGVMPVNFSIFPPTEYAKTDHEIKIPGLAPNEFVTITYLYFKDIHVLQTNILTKCDECLAKRGNMEYVEYIAEWRKNIIKFLAFVGCVSCIYFVISILILFFYNGFSC